MSDPDVPMRDEAGANAGARPSTPDAPGAGAVPRLFAHRYRLVGRRGSGIDVALFEAVDVVDDKTVAVRIVHPDVSARPGFDERFDSTMPRVASLHHPNLVEVRDLGRAQWDGRSVHYVVTENLTGGSLRDLRDRGRKLSPSQAVMVGLDACRALDVVHRAGLVHGDIRPTSLVFGDDGRLRLVDVGLGALVAADAWADIATMGVERARFSSPEQAAGGDAVAKSDVYSLCLCLIEAVTDSLPFVGDSTVATLANRIDKLMPVSADLGPLASVLERAGRPDADDRCSASEFGRSLVQTAEKLPRPTPIALLGSGLFAEAPVAASPTMLATEPSARAPLDAVPRHGQPAASPPEAGDAAGDAGDAAGDAAGEAAGDELGVGRSVVDDDAAAHSATEDGSAVDDDLRLATDSSAPATGDSAQSPAQSPSPLPPPPAASVVAIADPLPVVPGIAAVPPPPPVDELPPPPPPVLSVQRGRRRLAIVAVIVALAVGLGGAVAWWSGRSDAGNVPELGGLEQGEALNMVSEFGWNVSVVEEPSDELEVGVVIRTDPLSGALLERGAALTIVVSSGPAPRELPDITGLTLAQATAELDSRGLVLEVTEQPNDETVPAGVVLRWSISDQPALAAGDTVLPGTVVSAAVSAGPAPRVVPSLGGLSLADATQRLAEVDLVITQAPDEFSSDVPLGAVARQDPAPGTELDRGTAVTVALSKGPDLVVIPPLAGLTPAQATEALNAAGLAIGAVKGDPAGVNILSEFGGRSIGAGESFPRGTAIDLTFGVPAG